MCKFSLSFKVIIADYKGHPPTSLLPISRRQVDEFMMNRLESATSFVEYIR